MNKIAKIAVGITLAASVGVLAGSLAGCSGTTKSGEAYGLVNAAGSVGYAKIVYKNDKVSDCVLTEVCLPTQVKAGETVDAADKVGNYYKTVKYGDVTLTYDDTAEDYKVDATPFKTYLQTEANCKVYYEAVINNQISVTVGGQQKTDVMTKAKLSKEENGYWSKDTNTAFGSKLEGDYKWKANRDATVKYVKDNGTSKLSNLTRNSDDYWTDGTIVTGATWTTLNPTDKGGVVYCTYAELILKADGAVK